jgi:fatty acid desaturase
VLIGGLNYQIEHHLFPSMCRPNLHRAQRVVHRFCEQRGVSFAQASLVETYAAVLRYLNAVGADLRHNCNPEDPDNQVHAPASRKRTDG